MQATTHDDIQGSCYFALKQLLLLLLLLTGAFTRPFAATGRPLTAAYAAVLTNDAMNIRRTHPNKAAEVMRDHLHVSTLRRLPCGDWAEALQQPGAAAAMAATFNYHSSGCISGDDSLLYSYDNNDNNPSGDDSLSDDIDDNKLSVGLIWLPLLVLVGDFLLSICIINKLTSTKIEEWAAESVPWAAESVPCFHGRRRRTVLNMSTMLGSSRYDTTPCSTKCLDGGWGAWRERILRLMKGDGAGPAQFMDVADMLQPAIAGTVATELDAAIRSDDLLTVELWPVQCPPLAVSLRHVIGICAALIFDPKRASRPNDCDLEQQEYWASGGCSHDAVLLPWFALKLIARILGVGVLHVDLTDVDPAHLEALRLVLCAAPNTEAYIAGQARASGPNHKSQHTVTHPLSPPL